MDDGAARWWVWVWHAAAAAVVAAAPVGPRAPRPWAPFGRFRDHAWFVVAVAWACAVTATPCRRTHRHGWCGCAPSKGRLTRVRARAALALCTGGVAAWTWVRGTETSPPGVHADRAAAAGTVMVVAAAVALYHLWWGAYSTRALLPSLWATMWAGVGVASTVAWTVDYVARVAASREPFA